MKLEAGKIDPNKTQNLICQQCAQKFLGRKGQKFCANYCYRRSRTFDDDQTFWNKVEKTSTCWFWRGYKGKNGYGLINRKHFSKIPILAHRFSYEMLIGKIPYGLTLDHLCKKRNCVNPTHLEPVSLGENSIRGDSPPAINKRKTHCNKGHELSGDNLLRDKNGWRKCSICTRNNRRNFYLKNHR